MENSLIATGPRPDLLPKFGPSVAEVEVVSFDYGARFGMEVRTVDGKRYEVRIPDGDEAEAIEVLKGWLND